MIFEGRKACIGYMLTFDLIGSKFLVDVKGRPMFLRSKDSHFNGQVMAAVSKFYPMLLGELKSIAVCSYIRRLINQNLYFQSQSNTLFQTSTSLASQSFSACTKRQSL